MENKFPVLIKSKPNKKWKLALSSINKETWANHFIYPIKINDYL